jgi:iron(III) transport system substrate-binding protein
MSKRFSMIGVLLLAALFIAACQPETIEVTRVVEVEGETMEVTRVVEVEGETMEVTRIVEVEGEPVEVEVPVEVTPTPIGGELVLYACLFDPDKLEVIFETFKAQYGVDVTCLDMSSGEALERIRAESENPQGDVLFGTTNLSHVNLAADGLTEPYKGDGWSQLPDGAIKDPDGAWTGFYYGVIGFACSPERLEEIGAECPSSWEQLLDPVYAPGRMAAAGEFAIGISFAHDIQVQQDQGLPVEIGFPSEGTPFEIGGISIIKGAQNLPAAQAWVDYVFSPAFQRYHNDVAHRIPVVEGVELAEGTFGLDDVKLVDGYDPTEWAAQRDDLVARWQEEIGSLR